MTFQGRTMTQVSICSCVCWQCILGSLHQVIWRFGRNLRVGECTNAGNYPIWYCIDSMHMQTHNYANADAHKHSHTHTHTHNAHTHTQMAQDLNKNIPESSFSSWTWKFAIKSTPLSDLFFFHNKNCTYDFKIGPIFWGFLNFEYPVCHPLNVRFILLHCCIASWYMFQVLFQVSQSSHAGPEWNWTEQSDHSLSLSHLRRLSTRSG